MHGRRVVLTGAGRSSSWNRRSRSWSAGSRCRGATRSAFLIEGRYVAFETPRSVTVGSVVDELHHVDEAPGEVRFVLGGQALRLTVAV